MLAASPVSPPDLLSQAWICGHIAFMFWLCRAALPHMRPGSSVINTTSIESSQPTGELLPYAATEAAIPNFTIALA